MSEAAISRLQANRDHGELKLDLMGETLWALRSGALWWPREACLIVSDLHLEKGSSYAMRGQMLPPYDTRATLSGIAGMMCAFAPKKVISLGDSFHDGSSEARLSADDRMIIRHLVSQCDWYWVEGNHDPLPPVSLGGTSAYELKIGPLIFRHEPIEKCEPGEIAGHYHPCVKISGDSGRSVRTRCFLANEHRIIMPALGAFTGGLNVLDEAYSPLFPDGGDVLALGRDSVYNVSRQKLRPDRVKPKTRWRL